MEGDEKQHKRRGRPKAKQQKTRLIKKQKKQSKESKKIEGGCQSLQMNDKQRSSKLKEKKASKLKKNRNRSQAKLGRPYQSQKVEVEDDPSEGVQSCLLEYLSNIGLKHGLVFRQQERQKMNKQKEGFKPWQSQDNWNQEIERGKIEKNDKFMSVIQNYSKQIKINVEMLKKVFITIGQLATGECTQQIYIILCQAIKQIQEKKKNPKQRQKQQIDLFNRLKFLNGKFTNLRIKYWLQIKEEKIIIEQFGKMLNKLKSELIKLFGNPEKINSFYAEQKWMSQELNKIKKKKK